VNLLLGLLGTFFDQEALLRASVGASTVDCMPAESVFRRNYLVGAELQKKQSTTKVICDSQVTHFVRNFTRNISDPYIFQLDLTDREIFAKEWRKTYKN